MEVLEDVRRIYDKPMVLSSAFRDLSHPVETRKSAPGMHALGRAVDVLERVVAKELMDSSV